MAACDQTDALKKYTKLAQEINRIHPTMFDARGTRLGVCVFIKIPASIPHIKVILEESIPIKKSKTKVYSRPDLGLLCVR